MTKKPTQANGRQVRGKPFRKGKSGNPNGRPKGARDRPVELTVEQEVERLQQRAVELVVMGETDAAVTAFEKVFVLSWGAQGGRAEPGEAREKAREIVALIERENRVNVLRDWFDDADAEFLQHVGLPADATWDQWRAHYTADDGSADVDRVGNDLATFPPIAAEIAKLAAERANQ